jgi:hypothetical protein
MRFGLCSEREKKKAQRRRIKLELLTVDLRQTTSESSGTVDSGHLVPAKMRLIPD